MSRRSLECRPQPVPATGTMPGRSLPLRLYEKTRPSKASIRSPNFPFDGLMATSESAKNASKRTFLT